jgi:hypothetical protein
MSKKTIDDHLVEQIGSASYIPTPPVAHAVTRVAATAVAVTPFLRDEKFLLSAAILYYGYTATVGNWQADNVIYRFSLRNFRPGMIPSSFYTEHAHMNLDLSQQRIGFALLFTGIGMAADAPTMFYMAGAAAVSAFGKYAMRHVCDRHLYHPPE